VLLDIAEVEDGSTLRADVLIVGAGAAGLSVAQRLAGGRVQVLLIESGGLELDFDTQELCQGELAGVPYEPLDFVRLRFFGGTTNHWGGQSHPLEPADFEARPGVPQSGWPIGHADLLPWLTDAQAVCGIGAESFAWSEWAARPFVPAFPLDAARFAPLVFRTPHEPRRFGEAFRETMRTAENIRCLLHANLLHLVTEDSGGSVRSAVVGSLGGRRVSVEARHVVLAAGAIENCRLLLLSPGRSGRGIGNEHDVVGRYFMEHPNYQAGEVRLADVAAARFLGANTHNFSQLYWLRYHVQLNAAEQARLGILNHSMFLLPPRDEDEVDDSAAGRLADFWARATRRLRRMLASEDFAAHSLALRFRFEVAPNPDSRITLARELDALGQRRTRLDLRFTELESRTMMAASEALAAELGRLGLGRVRLQGTEELATWHERVRWQHHLSGGTRMHDDPKRGVVDSDCRVHGLDNVYVAGSSVFPTGGHTNPTLNLVALSLRLAEHLRHRVEGAA
jgi:choline dehydrogenase-like flavoprotein